MKLVTFTESDNTRIGLLQDDGIVDLSQAGPELPRDMLGFIAAGPDALARAGAIRQAAHYARDAVRLEAPIPRPGKVIAIGLNYRSHAIETNSPIPEVPLVFTKQATSVTGPYDPIFWSEDSKALDFEGELGIVIAKDCRRVPKEKAHELIFGLTIVNDVSVRDWQKRGIPPSFTMGKSWDSHCPCGPCIAVDPALDPHDLQLKTWVNGELRQHGRTNDLIFDCYALIAFLSTAFTLEAGDIIVTGTPSGVGMADDPPTFLVPGDRVQIEIGDIGSIENEVIEEPDEAACFY